MTEEEAGQEASVEWRYALDHTGGYETRAEAVAEAAILNRDRPDERQDIEVWAYPVCDCDGGPAVTLDLGRVCGRCEAVVA